MADDAAIGPLVKRDGVGRRSRLIIVPDFHVEGEGDQHGSRPGFARAGDPECLEDRAWDLCLVSNKASPMPLRALVRPGPGTTQKTPTSPVTRAAASAMTLEEAS